MNGLARANLLLLVLLAGHTADHAFNQPPRHYGLALTAPGIAGFVVTALALAMALRRSALAAPVSVAVGLSTIAGFALIHLAPSWGVFSDPYSAFSPNAVSWALVAAPMAAAALLTLVAVRQLRGESAPVRQLT